MSKSSKGSPAKAETVAVVVSGPEVYTLNDKALALSAIVAPMATLQTPDKALGRAWRSAAYTQPNTRVAALATILAVAPCTAEQAQAALAAGKLAGLNLGTGTPRSYVKAFIKNGYMTKV